MSFFNWISNQFSPGPVGNLRLSKNYDEGWKPKGNYLIALLTVLGVVLFGLFIWWILKGTDRWSGFLVLGLYLLASYFLTPQPHHDNMGWARGLIDNPFRISDNANRMLALFAIVLLPGKIVLYAAAVIRNIIAHYLLRS